MARPIHTADAVVIGGGLHGCATALYLSKAGLKAVVLEKDHVGRHASGVNAGGVRSLGRALPEIPLAVAALAQWHTIRGLLDDDCGFVSPGQIRSGLPRTKPASGRSRRAAGRLSITGLSTRR